MSENIGLKLANGEFYPVLQADTAARKRLVVTTVQDSQASVQIDLYRGSGPRTEGASYIGSLVIEGIPPRTKGEPDIRMDLGLDADGTLTAYAVETSTGASQSLKVSLESLAEEEKYEIPDFEFSRYSEAEVEAKPEPSFADEDFAETDVLPGEEANVRLLADEAPPEEPAPRRSKTWLVVLAIVAALALVLVLAYFLIPGLGAARPEPAANAARSAQVAPVQPAPSQAPAASAARPAAAAPVTAAAAPEAAPAAAPQAPIVSEKPGTPAKQPGAYYRIKWGDTLWDLSYSFYRNPWLFGKIAKANKIRNPDLIFSGNKIWIPPR
ncbi:MAG TPA: Hsp70 family protein [Rectinemataceae bacterium]|nr:Hsp70 family protein [Rectinemataceae bacterium]